MGMGMGMEYGKDKGNKGYGIWWYGKNRVGYMNIILSSDLYW